MITTIRFTTTPIGFIAVTTGKDNTGRFTAYFQGYQTHPNNQNLILMFDQAFDSEDTAIAAFDYYNINN